MFCHIWVLFLNYYNFWVAGYSPAGAIMASYDQGTQVVQLFLSHSLSPSFDLFPLSQEKRENRSNLTVDNL